MLSIYSYPSTWIAIVIAGVIGCVVTAAVANWKEDVPFSAVAGNWAKYVWSIIFCIPVPALLLIPFGYLWAFLWLMLAPTAASKVHFGPKDLPAMTLNTFHAGFALAALIVFYVAGSI